MVPKKPGSPKNEQRKESEGSRTRCRGEPMVQKRMDSVKNWERAIEFNREIVKDTSREWTAEK